MADDDERLATELTYEEALALKKEMVKRLEIDETRLGSRIRRRQFGRR